LQPIFVDNVSNITVKEDTPVGSVVAKVLARDADSGNYGRVTYLLDRKSSLGKFLIDSETGQLRVAEPLDREEQASFTLVIQAWDNFQFGYASGESRSAFKQITVAVSDINDSPPEFVVEDNAKDCASVTEFHEDVVMTIRAKDRTDGSSFIFHDSTCE
jgi:cadherin 23